MNKDDISKAVFAVQSINKVIQYDMTHEDTYGDHVFNNYIKTGLLVAVELITTNLNQQDTLSHKGR